MDLHFKQLYLKPQALVRDRISVYQVKTRGPSKHTTQGVDSKSLMPVEQNIHKIKLVSMKGLLISLSSRQR